MATDIDTGSAVTLISENTWKKLNLNVNLNKSMLEDLYRRSLLERQESQLQSSIEHFTSVCCQGTWA